MYFAGIFNIIFNKFYFSDKHKWGYLVPDPDVVEIDGASVDEAGRLKLKINPEMEQLYNQKVKDGPTFPLKSV